jgi:hypothetical protein
MTAMKQSSPATPATAEEMLLASDRHLEDGRLPSAVRCLQGAVKLARAKRDFGLIAEARARLLALGRNGRGHRFAGGKGRDI